MVKPNWLKATKTITPWNVANRGSRKLYIHWQIWEQEPEKQSWDSSPPLLLYGNNLPAKSTHYPLSLTQLKCYNSAPGKEACQNLDRPVGGKVCPFMRFSIDGVQYLCHYPSVLTSLAITKLTFISFWARLLCLYQVNKNSDERFRLMLCTGPLQTPKTLWL